MEGGAADLVPDLEKEVDRLRKCAALVLQTGPFKSTFGVSWVCKNRAGQSDLLGGALFCKNRAVQIDLLGGPRANSMLNMPCSNRPFGPQEVAGPICIAQ